ncbi:MAG: hypothetical protein HC892_12810 [Saprospiraceae bacterium]|nr:hypothetical protein [Saprospiraceae bacterium]
MHLLKCSTVSIPKRYNSKIWGKKDWTGTTFVSIPKTVQFKVADARRVLAEQTEARDKAIREQAKREKAVAIIQSIVNTALAVTRALATGNIVTAIGAGITGAAQTAIIAAQPLAKGGVVRPVQLADGQILASSNIPRQRNGDNVLATVKTGEVVLKSKTTKITGRCKYF